MGNGWRRRLVLGLLAFLIAAGSVDGQAAKAGQPRKTLKVAFVMGDVVETTWNRTMMLSLLQLKKEGYPFEFKYVEQLTRETIEGALRGFAEQKYDVILMHFAGGRDTLVRITKEYPGVVFLGGGYGYKTDGANFGAYDQCMHEAVYLCGVIAGMMTKSNLLGGVGAFPNPNIDYLFNAYYRGAMSVNPKIKLKVSYTSSYFDPVKAREATLSLIAGGADYFFAERDGVFAACEEKGVFVFGGNIDQHEVAPKAVVTTALVNWAPMLRKVFDQAAAGSFKGGYQTVYEGAMAAGLTGLAPYFGFDSVLPANVKSKVEEVKAKIINRSLAIPLETARQWP
jgi:basic membrane protein A and related proteins